MTSKLSGIFDVDFSFIRVHKTHVFAFSATRIDFITLIACDTHKRDFFNRLGLPFVHKEISTNTVKELMGHLFSNFRPAVSNC